jgi:hypothetical protein
MIIGRLFVALGVKGPKKALSAIGDVKKGLKETAGVGLETKAAIIGAVYALERMFSRSNQAGADLMNFNATLGVSAKTLQQYQYAARQVGVSNAAVEGTFRSLQSTITNTLMGKGAPEGLARVAQVVAQVGKNMSAFDLTEFKDDPSKLIQRLQEYAQLEKDAGMRNAVLKSFGLGDDMIAALTRNAFRPEVMAKAPTYTDSQIKALDQNNAAWSNLGNKIEMAFGKLNAQHGGQLVRDIDKITTAAIKLSEQLLKTANDLKVFELISNVFKGWTSLLSGDMTAATKDLAKTRYGDDGLLNQARVLFDALMGTDYYEEDQNKRDAKAQHSDMQRKAEDVKTSGLNAPWTQEEIDAIRNRKNAGTPAAPIATVPMSPVAHAAPAAAPSPAPGAAVTNAPNAAAPAAAPQTVQTQNVNVNVKQDLNFQHDGKDARQTGDSVRRATQNALRQMPGLAQGS